MRSTDEFEHYNKMVKSFRMMAKRNDIIQDTHGNLSCRIDSNRIIIKPSGVMYEDIMNHHLCEIEFDNSGWKQLSGQLKPSVDTVHHVNIYRNNPNINSICHTHSPYATAYAIAGAHIFCRCTEHADYFGTTIQCMPYSDLNSWGAELCVNIDRIESNFAVLLAKHGVLTFANDPITAANLAVQVESIARKNFISETICSVRDTDSESMTAGEVDKWHKRYTNSYGQK
jgi:L-ribulose-5-phosphate 4-epimerase